MVESALQSRLDRIERRLLLVVSMLVGGYVFGGSWILIEAIDTVTVWNVALGLVVLAVVTSIGGIYRRRQARQ